MKYYFRKWKESDTSDNFFRWWVSHILLRLHDVLIQEGWIVVREKTWIWRSSRGNGSKGRRSPISPLSRG